MRKILSFVAAFFFAASMMADPVVLPAVLDVSNVSFRSEGMPDFVIPEGQDYAGTYFDMGAHDSSNDTLLYAEWDVTIQPIKYNLAVDVYNTNSWRVQLYLLNQAGDTVKDLRYKGSSGQKGQFSIGSLDLRDLAAGNYKLRARAATAWSAMKLKDVIFEADYQGVPVALPGILYPAYAELSSGASLANGAIAFAPSTANNEYATWNVSFAEAGNYNVGIDITASNGHTYGVALLSADGQTQIGAVAEAQSWDTGAKELGIVAVPAAGDYKVKLTNATQWSEALLNSIGFLPAAPIEPNMKTIYCKMDKAWWTADGAAIGLYTWDGTTTTPKAAWPGERMTPVEGETNIWSFELDINTYPMCIFTRVNPTGDIADWGAKSGDLVIPTDDNDMYTITSETAVWGDPGVAGEWSKYEPAQPILGTHFVKVTEAPADWAGEYLIVFETADTAHASVAMNGGLAAFDAASNGVAVSIEDNKIAVSEALLAAKFTIAAMNGGYSIKGASGKFIGAASYANSLLSSDTAIANVLSIADNKAVIAVNVMNQGNPAQVTMRYNYAKDQLRFRYYKSGQQPVALYKLTTIAPEPTHTYTVAGAPAAVFGEEWNASYEENDMEFLANQSYTWIKDSVVLRAGTNVQFKVVEDHAWAKAWPEQNYQLAIPEDGYYSIIIAFNLAADPDSVVEAKAVKVGEIEPAPEYSLWNVVSTTDTTHAVKYIDNEYLEVKTVYQGTVVAQNAVIFDETFTHAIQVRTDQYPSAEDVVGPVKAGSTPLVFTAKQDASIAIYYMRQAVNKAWSDNDNKDIILFDQAAPTVKIAAAKMEADSVLADSTYYFMAKSYNLQAGHTYTLTAKGTTIKLFGISYPAVPEPQHTYTVAGAPTTLFGKEWNASYAENDMESYGTDTYFWRRDSVALAAGNVEFKIVEDHGWAKGWPNQNYVIKIDSAGIYNITIMFKPKAADPDSMISVVVYKVGDAVVLPKIILHGNFTGSWADTEEFAIAEDNLTASLRLGLEAKAYEFGMKFDGVWKANGANITREAPSACLATGDGNMHITADQAGEYIFTYTFATQTLEVAYPKLIPHYGVHEAIAAATEDPATLAKNDLVYVRGIITKIEFKGTNFAKYGSACIYVADAAGAADTLEFYNCYSMNADTFKTSDPAYDATSTAWAQFNSVADANGVEIALGDTIEAFGKYNLYNGVHQLNQGCYLTVVNKYQPILGEPEYYLVGTMNEWQADSAYKFVKNEGAEGIEYKLTVALAENAELKVMGLVANDTLWYPDQADNYVVDAAHAGEAMDIYFRPNADGGNDWYHGVIFVPANVPELPEIALIGGMNGWDGNQGKFAPAADYKSAAWTINLDTLPADRGYAFKLLVDGIAMGSARDSAGNPFTFTPANNVLRPVDHVAVGDDEIFWLHMEDKVGEYTFIYTFADSSLKVVYPKVLPTTAPAAPTADEDDVMAVYCNHYATNNLHFEILGWGGVQTWKADTIDGVAIAYCEDMKYEFLTNWGAPKYDMSEYNKIHIDIWAPAAASVRLGIEALGVGEGGSGSKVGVVYNLNEGWNSIDAALEDFGYDFKDMKYVFFEWYKTPEGESFENNPFGFANIYFYEKESQALDNTSDGVKAQKYIHNGMLLIEKNGKVYTITGQVVR